MADNIKSTVKRIMRLFNEEYHNKFDITETRKIFWENALADFDDEVILHAAYHLTTVSQSDWPPVIGQLRKQCVLMSLGQLQPPTGEEAWEKVLEKVARKPVKLTDLEKKALAQTKTIDDLRQSSNIEADRARFMGALEKLVTKYIYDRQTLGEVKKFAASRVPQIEDKENTPKKIISHSEEQERVLVKDTNEPEYESPERIRELCQRVIGKATVEAEKREKRIQKRNNPMSKEEIHNEILKRECPLCDARSITDYGTVRFDSKCENGHEWHFCSDTGEIVIDKRRATHGKQNE